MSSVLEVNNRYLAAAEVALHGVDIVLVDDAPGKRFDSALWALIKATSHDDPTTWEEVIAPARALRWRRLTRPDGVSSVHRLDEAAQAASTAIHRLLGSTSVDTLLDELDSAMAELRNAPPPVTEVLVRSIAELGGLGCLVVGIDARSVDAISAWLGDQCAHVTSASALPSVEDVGDRPVYAVGPPRFFPPTLLGSPVTGDITFFMPSWFSDRLIPQSPLAKYADSPAIADPRIHQETNPGEMFLPSASLEALNEQRELLLAPQPITVSPSNTWTPTAAVRARKVLLSGSQSIWLDDGDRIRTLEPNQPPPDRVQYRDIDRLDTNTYLLIREGDSEHGALMKEALESLADVGKDVQRCQTEWKRVLQDRLRENGGAEVTKQLSLLGCASPHRVEAWADPKLIRPDDNHGFRVLLGWLGVDVTEAERNANHLRRAVHRVSTRVRRELESAAANADMDQLKRIGHLRIGGMGEDTRPLVAARILAISSEYALVSAGEMRVLMSEPMARWLE